MDVISKVKAGENSGRKLTHDFVVLSFDQKESAANEVTFELKRSEDARGTRSALAVWVSRDGEHRPMQAVGDWWEP
ncbi:MAG: hypothetical protein JWR69_3960 [Pedosphaera sp.]|nr:hypothetical protein [Pedosphaera sp.]